MLEPDNLEPLQAWIYDYAGWRLHAIACLSIVAAALAWLTLLIGLPGNWMIVSIAVLHAWLGSAAKHSVDSNQGVGWTGVALLAGMALFGELVELLAGAIGAAKHGASRRAAAMSTVGALVGGLAGALVGAPIPILGSLVAALIGSVLGAFLGGYLGQTWARGTHTQSVAVGRGAMVGRLWGVAGKLAVGAVMLVALAVDLWR